MRAVQQAEGKLIEAQVPAHKGIVFGGKGNDPVLLSGVEYWM
jgi:hypothetical protein